MEKSIVYHFKETDQYLVIEGGEIIQICKTHDEASYYIPQFDEGDLVDVPGFGLKSVKIVEIGRSFLDNDLFYDVEGTPDTSFDANEVVPASNPTSD